MTNPTAGTITQYTKTLGPGGAVLDQPNRQVSEKKARRADRRAKPSKKSPERKPTGGRSWRNEVNWPVVGWLVLLHTGMLAAPFCPRLFLSR
jgi:hypothetical protein